MTQPMIPRRDDSTAEYLFKPDITEELYIKANESVDFIGLCSLSGDDLRRAICPNVYISGLALGFLGEVYERHAFSHNSFNTGSLQSVCMTANVISYHDNIISPFPLFTRHFKHKVIVNYAIQAKINIESGDFATNVKPDGVRISLESNKYLDLDSELHKQVAEIVNNQTEYGVLLKAFWNK